MTEQLTRSLGRGLSRPLISWLAVATLVASAPASSADFYAGKTITIVVASTPGGTYDTTARLYARFLTGQLAGRPSIIIQNMPGAGSMVATNYLYNEAKRDGTVLGVSSGNVVLEPLLGNPQARYDGRRFGWIGGRTAETFLCVLWHSAPADTIEQAKRNEIVLGTTGQGSRTMSYPLALNELLGTKFRLVGGYPGGNEITLAMEKGEVDGYGSWAWNSLKQRAGDWVRDRKVKFLVQYGLRKAADLPDVPLATELVSPGPGRDLMDFLVADTLLAWPLFTPPELPAERIAELRTAFVAAMQDPRLIEEAKKQALDLEPVSGADMQKAIEDLYRTPPEVIAHAKKITGG
jgi:tripartite-type tricarboxylate transporter receptor subunit TctC